MKKLERLLCLLLSLCMMICSLAQAQLVAYDDEDDAEVMAQFAFDESTEAQIAEMDGQWEIDASIDPDQLDINPNLPDYVINILLIGIDTRSRNMEDGARGDVMIVLSVNTRDGTIKLTSIMRDLYVTIPGYHNASGNKARINTAYSKGGGQLAMRTVNNLLELNIQNYVVINFYGLASIIDAIGGVDMDLTRTEAGAINTYLRKHPPAYDNKAAGERIPLEKVAGVQHLDGVQAVMYARLREIDNDFQRTARQRHLLEVLLSTIMDGMNMETLISLVNTAMSYARTNMSIDAIVRLAIQVMQPLLTTYTSGGSMIQQMRVPMGENNKATWKYATVNGASVIQFRSNKRQSENVQAVHEFIYGEYIPAK